MSDESDTPPPEPKPKPKPYAKPMVFRSDEAKRAYEKRVREERIEQIASIMRQMSTKAGKPAWDRKVRKALAISWGVSDSLARFYAKKASDRIHAELTNPDSIYRTAGVGLMDGLAHAHAKKDWKTYAQLAAIAFAGAQKGREREVIKVEVSPSAAGAHTKEVFGEKGAKKLDATSLADLAVDVHIGAPEASPRRSPGDPTQA